MSKFYKTYVIGTNKTLHDWSKEHQLNPPPPCDFSLMGKKLVRYQSAPPDSNGEWNISNPLVTSNGEPFKIQVKLCLTKNKGRSKLRPDFKYKAITKESALDWLCDVAGLEVATDEDKFYKRIEPVRDIYIHGQLDINTFVISGTFRVTDEDKFLKAYNEGVGRRKSYGCGMIFVI